MTQKYRTLEGKNRTLGAGRGIKNGRKLSDIIYECSLAEVQDIFIKNEAKGVVFREI